jgi:hypothetical protein
MGEKRNLYEMLIRNTEEKEKRLLGRPSHRREENVTWDTCIVSLL